MIGLADFQLTPDIFKSVFFSAGPANNVVYDDSCICSITNWVTMQCGELLPDAVDIVDEINRSCRPICWPKRHNIVGPLYGVDPLKRELFLTRKRNGKLMISHRRVKHPDEFPHTKLDKHCSITSRDRVSDDLSNTVKGNVINTEAPDKIINVLDVLLVGFWPK